MSTHLSAEQQMDDLDHASVPALEGMESSRRAQAALPDEDVLYRRPACLLAIAIHELGCASAASRLARATNRDALAERLERERDGWGHLYEVTCQRICPALREEAIEPEAVSIFADAALAAMPPTVPDDILAYLRRRLTACATYATADDCPFLNPSAPGAPEDAAL